MNFWELVFIALGLSMDALAVSIVLGLSANKLSIKHFLSAGLYFGFFQAVMPLIGFYSGTLFASKLADYGHWVAFALLCMIGGKMVKDSFLKDPEKIDDKTFVFLKMLVLAIVTSIDALAVGVTFAFFEIKIFRAVFLIGFTTFCISIAGVKLGNLFGSRHKSKAEFVGGAVLILIGIKILIDNLF